jgi:hypothetical protein
MCLLERYLGVRVVCTLHLVAAIGEDIQMIIAEIYYTIMLLIFIHQNLSLCIYITIVTVSIRLCLRLNLDPQGSLRALKNQTQRRCHEL